MSDNALPQQIQGSNRRDILARFTKQLDRWGLAIPPVEPLVIDFGGGDFDRVGLIECWIANEPQAGYCGKYMFLFSGQRCPSHSHRQKHETFFIVNHSDLGDGFVQE